MAASVAGSRASAAFAVLLVVGLGCTGRGTPSIALPSVADGPTAGPLAAMLDSIAPRASGLFLAKVARTSEESVVDGPVYQRVHLEVLRSSGVTTSSLELVRSRSGFDTRTLMGLPSLPPPTPRFTIKPDELQVGHRYWFATSALYDSAEYPVGIAGCWAADSTGLDELFSRAVEGDAYRWHPEFWPHSGFTTGWLDERDGRSSVFVWRGQRLLWQRKLDGLLIHTLLQLYINDVSELASLPLPGTPDTARVLRLEVRAKLDRANPYGLDAGPWRIRYLLEMWSGSIVGSRVREDRDRGDVERVFQAYDRRGKVTFERVQDFLAHGGVSVGSEKENWLRRVESWYEPNTGQLERREVRRLAGSDWLLVDRERGLAAGPLKTSSRP